MCWAALTLSGLRGSCNLTLPDELSLETSLACSSLGIASHGRHFSKSVLNATVRAALSPVQLKQSL